MTSSSASAGDSERAIASVFKRLSIVRQVFADDTIAPANRAKRIRGLFAADGMSSDDAIKARKLHSQYDTDEEVRGLCTPIAGQKTLGWTYVRLLVGYSPSAAKRFATTAVKQGLSAERLSSEIQRTKKSNNPKNSGRRPARPPTVDWALHRLCQEATQFTKMCEEWFGNGPRAFAETSKFSKALTWSHLLNHADMVFSDMKDALRKVQLRFPNKKRGKPSAK